MAALYGRVTLNPLATPATPASATAAPAGPLVVEYANGTRLTVDDPLAVELLAYLAASWAQLGAAGCRAGALRLTWGEETVHAVLERHDAPRVARRRPARRARPE